MISPFLRIFGLLSIACALCVSRAAAQSLDPLEAAEQAYRDVNFMAQRDEATRALAAGNNDRVRLAQLYRLLGIAHAALDERGAAKEWFLRLLALEPDVELERVLSPRLRSPYLEARGFWDVTPERLGIDVLARGPHQDLSLRMRDPVGMVTRVRVRSSGTSPGVAVEKQASQTLVVTSSELAPHSASRLEIQLLDEHGNVLIERALPPLRTLPASRAQPGVAVDNKAAARRVEPAELDYPSLILAGAGVVALGFGVFQHVVRENEAFEWNSAACERPGFGTRGSQCAEVDANRRSAQRLAVASYSTGGLLLVAGLVTHLVAGGLDADSPVEPARAVACAGGPGALGLVCSTTW